MQPSLLDEARKLAESEGIALNQLINVALAERISALRTEEYFSWCALRADPAKVGQILRRLGKGKAPIEGDELPMARAAGKRKKGSSSARSAQPGARAAKHS